MYKNCRNLFNDNCR